MEELIKLINEYEKINMCRKFDNFAMHTFENSSGVDSMLEDTVISRRYGFIEWLVQEDKIDRHNEKLELDMKRMRIPQDYYIGGLQSLTIQHKKAQYLSLIALLSIQENPISFLTSILK